MNDFTNEQKSYLQGFTMGLDVARHVRGLPVLSGSAASATTIQIGGQAKGSLDTAPPGPDDWHIAAQDRFLAAGQKLSKEEEAKRVKHPFEMWDELTANAEKGSF